MVLALQVRRAPDVLAENVIHWLERLRPTFPVFRCGWNPEWPMRTLPWAILFDHEGREVFAGRPERAEPAILKALAAAPDHVIGGPYEEDKALAETIVADRAGLGAHLARARLRLGEDLHPETMAMIDSAERWYERRAARIEEHMPGMVEQAEAWDVLAKTYEGDILGKQAARQRDALRATPTFAAEEAAEMSLRSARTTFRRCPPHGGYFPYHFTKMNYTVIDDPVWVATRVRMLMEFRIELDRIVAAYPDTRAAEEASDLLFLNDLPELAVEAARDRVERAEGLLKTPGRPAQLYEAWLCLVEVREGHLISGELSARADELLTSIEKDRLKELIDASTEVRTLRDEADVLQRELQSGGSLLSRAKAEEITVRLRDIAKRSGAGTMIARQVASYVEKLASSFDGKPHLGVRLDPRFSGPGARIALVVPGSGAAKAGLAPGDVVMRIGGTTLADINDFTKALADKKPGEQVEVEVRRATGEVEILDVPLGRQLR